MIHGLIVLISCVIIYFLHLPTALMLGGVFYYHGREVAQAEYRYIEQYCNRKRANMPWYAVFSPKAWTLKGVLDTLIPAVIGIAGYIIATIWG